MGYYRRRAEGEALRAVFIVVGLALVSAWPWMLGTYIATNAGARRHSTAWNAAGWIPEAAWIIFGIVVALSIWNRAHIAAQDRIRYREQLAQHRWQMAQTHTPWFDPERGHFAHSTCSIKHRSEGAAARCSSRI